MIDRKLDAIKKHEAKIKKLLDVNPRVYYGEEAREKLQQYINVHKRLNGYYNPPVDEIYVIKINKYYTIGTLAHELRHAHQYNRKREEFIFYEDWYGSDPHYSCRKTELDANRFALSYCKENKLGRLVTSRYLKRALKIKLIRLLHKLKPGHSCPD